MDYFFFFKIFVASFIMTFIFVFSMGGCERFSWVYRVYDTL